MRISTLGLALVYSFIIGFISMLIPILLKHTTNTGIPFYVLPIFYLPCVYLGFRLKEKVYLILFLFGFGQFLAFLLGDLLYPPPVVNWIFPPILGIPVLNFPLWFFGTIGVVISLIRKSRNKKGVS